MRMPQNELLDLIYDAFREFKYWPLRSLKERVRQPEAYLKSTLEMVAHLVKQGPFSMTWQLNPDSLVNLEVDPDGVAPQVEGDFEDPSDSKEFEDAGASDNDDDDDDEGSIEMENVLPP